MNTTTDIPRVLTDVNARHLDALESEAIHIMREVAAECANPALLFSGGKDSVVLLRLAEKAFRPGKFPFPLVHIDTGHNFAEVIAFRDARAAELGERLIVGSVEESIRKGTVRLRNPATDSRNAAQAVTLLETIAEYKFDACIGGARRDEEKARAKERIFSFRDEFGQWDPKARTCACSRFRTGPSSMSGCTSSANSWRCRRSTSRTSARSSRATACWCR
jgi:sulfate adenylyltransferase subunit 2